MNLPPFYVGQQVVAIVDHPFGMFKKGDEFIITFIRKSTCICPGWEVGVGIVPLYPNSHCHKCNCDLPIINNDHPFDAARFVPKQEEKFQSITLEKILQKESAFICVN